MFYVARALAVLVCTGSAHAATLKLINYALQPHHQRVLLTTQVSLGYPAGDVQVGLALDCRTGKVDMLDFKNRILTRERLNPFTTSDATRANINLRKAVLASGVVSVGPGLLTVKQAGGNVVSRCQQKVLDAALVSFYAPDPFREVEVPIYSQRAEPDLFTPDKLDYGADAVVLTTKIYPAQSGYDFRDIHVQNPSSMDYTPNPREQVLVSDGQSLFPIYYAGEAQDNSSWKQFRRSTVLTVYITMDGTHWFKTTIDAKANRVRTTPTAKPTLLVRS